MIGSVEEIPVPTQYASCPGQRDLFGELMQFALLQWRRCNVCADLNQDVPQSIYPADADRCPVCRCQEFQTPTAEQMMARPKTAISDEFPGSTVATVDKSKLNGKSPKATRAVKVKNAEAANVEVPELRTLRLDLVDPDEENPRTDEEIMADPETEELANTLGPNGPSQPCVVREKPNGRFGLVIGHRRRVAMIMKGFVEAPFLVQKCTDAAAVEMQIIENAQRKDLDPIQEARAFKRGMEVMGINQAELATKIGKTQGHISNRLRLLNLPEVFHPWLRKRRFTPTQGRTLAVFADVKSVMEDIAVRVNREIETRGEDLEQAPPEIFSEYAFDSMLTVAVEENLRPMGDYNYDQEPPKFTITPKIRKQLDIREIETDGGDREGWAVNVELWDKLQAEAEGNEPDLNHHSDDVEPGATKPATDEKAKEEKAKALYQKRLYRYKVAWLQKAIQPRLTELTDEQILVLVVALTVLHPDSERLTRFNQAAKSVTKGDGITPHAYADPQRWREVLTLDRGKLRKILIEFFTLWCDMEARSFSSDACPVAFEMLASELGIDMAKSWEVDQDFCEIHTVEQLIDLVDELKLKRPDTTLTKKSQYIDHMVENKYTRQTVGVLPKCLAKLKPVTLD